MTKAALRRHPGVYCRTDSGIYQFGLRAPADLRMHFPSAWAVRCSLGTGDLRKANEKAKALQSEWVTRFEALRTGRPIQVDLAALRASLLTYVERSLVAVDLRAAALSAEKREESAAQMAWLRAEAEQAQAAGTVPDWANGWLNQMGYLRSVVTDTEAMAYLVMQLGLYEEAFKDETRAFPVRVQSLRARRALVDSEEHSLSVSVQAEPRATPSRKAKGFRITDALDAWAETTRPAKTLSAFTRHAEQFKELMGDPVLSSVDRPLAVQFRDRLQAWALNQGKTARTADNVLVSIRALVSVARDRGWLDVNPFERLTVNVGGRESEGREPWTHDELRVLFDDPIWNSYRLPADRKAGADAAYWIPLLACFTGARVSEIAQLWTDDLSLEKGSEVIEFKADVRREQQLKTEGSWRAVPMHPELVRLGLPEYAASLPKGKLFPHLPTSGKNGPGGQFSHWFGAFKRKKGFASSSKTLHSFRHLVSTELRLAGASDPQADAILGHAGQGTGRTVYSATIRRQALRLQAVMELLNFPELHLPRVWRSTRT